VKHEVADRFLTPLEALQLGVVKATIPDATVDPVLYALVCNLQIHRHKKGKCSEGHCPRFPKIKSDQDFIDDEGKIYYKRHTDADTYVNPYNPILLRAWRASIDIQVCDEKFSGQYLTK
jgi:hypothetical protein